MPHLHPCYHNRQKSVMQRTQGVYSTAISSKSGNLGPDPPLRDVHLDVGCSYPSHCSCLQPSLTLLLLLSAAIDYLLCMQPNASELAQRKVMSSVTLHIWPELGYQSGNHHQECECLIAGKHLVTPISF